MVVTTSIQNQLELPRIPEPKNLREEQQKIVTRLFTLRTLVDELRDSGRIASSVSKAFPGVLVDGLFRKEGVATWTLRVAKHSTGAAQQKLFADVRKSLDELEMIVELILHQSSFAAQLD